MCGRVRRILARVRCAAKPTSLAPDPPGRGLRAAAEEQITSRSDSHQHAPKTQASDGQEFHVPTLGCVGRFGLRRRLSRTKGRRCIGCTRHWIRRKAETAYTVGSLRSNSPAKARSPGRDGVHSRVSPIELPGQSAVARLSRDPDRLASVRKARDGSRQARERLRYSPGMRESRFSRELSIHTN
jgi:hypothetical protein